MFTLAAALIGAMIGSIGAAFFEKLREDRQDRKILVQRHLFQLQDAIEDLYHRLDNLWRRDGYTVMEEEYFEVTTLYAIGKVLAVERIMSLEGIYPKLDLLNKKFGQSLRRRRGDLQLRDLLNELNFQRYEGRALAESAMEYSASGFRTSTFLEFKRRYYESSGAQKQEWLSLAREKVYKLPEPRVDSGMDYKGFLTRLQEAANEIADKTMVGSTIYNK